MKKNEFNPMLETNYNSIIKMIPLKEIIHKKCIIPANTQLYRKHINTNYKENMFFSFDIHGCNTAYYNDIEDIQIWETQKDIEAPYRVISINKGGQINGSLEVIYFEFYKIWMPALRFKKFDYPKRIDFINRLKQKGDIGWVSSVDDGTSAELFLMNSLDNKKDMIIYKESKKFNQLIDVNSFHFVKEIY